MAGGNLFQTKGSETGLVQKSTRPSGKQQPFKQTDTALAGSWYVEIKPSNPKSQAFFGVVRIGEKPQVKISGDLYSAKPRQRFFFKSNHWYPNFFKTDYRWFFQSQAIAIGQELETAINSYHWDRDRFTQGADGALRLKKVVSSKGEDWLEGELMMDGETWLVHMQKTSPYFRGCFLEVQTMAGNTRLKKSTELASRFSELKTAFLNLGLELEIEMSERDPIVNFDDEPVLANQKLGFDWQILTIIGEQGDLDSDDYYGLMFDQKAPVREGVLIFSDKTLSCSTKIREGDRGKAISSVPLAFMRMVAHEVGHALNLGHYAGEDNSGYPVTQKTLMFTTSDVVKQSTQEHPFPCSAQFEFMHMNCQYLVHAPDVQVMPGWQSYNWRWHKGLHGFKGRDSTEEPSPAPPWLQVTLEWPAENNQPQAGSFLWVDLVFENKSDEKVKAISPWGLFDGHLSFNVTGEDKTYYHVSSAIVPCRDSISLEFKPKPNEKMRMPVQLYFTSHGHIFDQPGTYKVKAIVKGFLQGNKAFETNELKLTTVQDGDEALYRRMRHPAVGLAFALGFTKNKGVKELLRQVADANFGDTSLASELLLANSTFEGGRQTMAPGASEDIKRQVDRYGWSKVFQITAALVGPLNLQSPLLQQAISLKDEEGVIGKDVPANVQLLNLLQASMQD